MFSLLFVSFFAPLGTVNQKEVSAQLAVSVVGGPGSVADIKTSVSSSLTAGATTITAEGTSALVLKDFTLDGTIGWAIAKMMLRAMTQSVLAWASNGFQGNPAFVQDPKRFFGSVADQTLGQLIYDTEALKWLCSPFQFQLRRAIVFGRSFQQQNQCTLSQVISNFDGFVSGLNNELGDLGGWDAWVTMTTLPQNNPYGAYALLSAQAEAKISGAKEFALLDINLGEGFFSWKDPSCVAKNQQAERTRATYEGTVGSTNSVGLTKAQQDTLAFTNDTGSDQPSATQGTIYFDECKTLTPGSVIAKQINDTLAKPGQELVAADEITEVIGAVLTGLLRQVLGGSGLAGAGSGDSSNGESAYMQQFIVEDRQEFERSKGENIKLVVDRSHIENNYITVKNQSIGRLEVSASATRQVLQCGVSNSAASSTLTLIESYAAPLKRDVAIAETNIVNSKKVTDAVLALTYERRDNLARVMGQFSSLYSQLHHEGDVANAEYERDYSIPERLITIDAANASTLSDCRNNSNFNSNNNVNTSGGGE